MTLGWNINVVNHDKNLINMQEIVEYYNPL